MTMIPLGHRVLVKIDELETESEGGIVFRLENKRERGGQIYGRVAAVGEMAYDWCPDKKPWCKVGDHVIFARYAGKNVTDLYSDIEYVVLNDEDIIARLEESEDE